MRKIVTYLLLEAIVNSPDSGSWSSGHRCPGVLQAKLSHLYSMKQVVNLMLDYEMKAGFQYDMVVNTRWDITDLPETKKVVEFKAASSR